MTIEHRAELNAVVYGLFRAPALDRETAASMAEAMLAREYFVDGPEAYAKAIAQALAQPDPVTADIEPPYREAEVREFLEQLLKEIEKLGPLA